MHIWLVSCTMPEFLTSPNNGAVLWLLFGQLIVKLGLGMCSYGWSFEPRER